MMGHRPNDHESRTYRKIASKASVILIGKLAGIPQAAQWIGHTDILLVAVTNAVPACRSVGAPVVLTFYDTVARQAEAW